MRISAHRHAVPIGIAGSLVLWPIAATGAAPDVERRPALVPQTETATDRGPLRINEPMYFVVGGGDRTSARFQLSFRYRLLDAPPGDSPALSWVDNLHFGYTQTALWDLAADSNPFEDSSYRPSLFYETDEPGSARWGPDHFRVGIEHESNGRAGPASRSINTAFAWGFWALSVGERDLYLAPKIYAYLTQADENEDIDDYRGYGDYLVAYGDPDGWMATANARVGTEARGSLQVELSHPVREDFLPRLGGYFFAQFFTGYGETILGYDQRRSASLRIGYAIVR